ncbi:MAG TPA: HD domain-containing protein [Melioribacteraceae bacterium]|nr:HD domain-containing protein [Melioribacteraceae bacterium]
MKNSLLKKAEEYALSILYDKTPKAHVYHDVNHTQEVIASALEIGEAENLTEEDLEIVQLAACFHDVGYVKKSDSHEEVSAEYAGDFLANEKYPPEKIEKVKGCILATRVPQKPKNLLEKVICDADLSHLGKKNFINRNDLFRVEFEHHFGRSLTELEWLEKSIEFMSEHKFFTSYAREVLEPLKLKHLNKLKNILSELRSFRS